MKRTLHRGNASQKNLDSFKGGLRFKSTPLPPQAAGISLPKGPPPAPAARCCFRLLSLPCTRTAAIDSLHAMTLRGAVDTEESVPFCSRDHLIAVPIRVFERVHWAVILLLQCHGHNPPNERNDHEPNGVWKPLGKGHPTNCTCVRWASSHGGDWYEEFAWAGDKPQSRENTASDGKHQPRQFQHSVR